MNRPPESYVLVQEERLLTFASTCFERVGLDADHAASISRLLVNSDLRGVRSHGTRTVNGYCQAFEAGRLNPQPQIRQVHETPTAVVLDGDGTLEGYDVDLTAAISHAVNIPVIASGGAGHPSHFAAALNEGGAAAALAASLFHFRQLSIMDVKRYLADQGIDVRMPVFDLLD